MGKILGSVAFLIAILVGGFVYDAGFHAKVVGMFGKSDAVAPVASGSGSWSKASEGVHSAATNDGRLEVINHTGVVHASVQSPSVPFFSVENGKPKGFNVDFMHMLFKQSEFVGRITVDTGNTVETYADVPKQLLSNKNVDIAIDGLTFNDDDLPGVVYTIPYVKDFGYSLITTKGTVVSNAADLTGMKVGILQGDPDVRAFAEQAFPGAKIVEVSDKVDATGKFIVGHFNAHRIDAMVYDYPFAVAEVDGTNLQFAMTKIKGSDIQYRIGVRKGDTDLLAALNSAIRKVMDKPEYADMLKTYFMSTNVAAVRRASSGEVGYVVARGDTLSTIALSQLGDIKRYTDIQTRNNLANPNFITIGQKLVIPSK
jgi:ABC-type amino acid transport substrate-binding protein